MKFFFSRIMNFSLCLNFFQAIFMKTTCIYRCVLFSCLLLFFAGCTDKKAEEEIGGQWRAIELEEDETGTVHSLPEGIFMEFDYPVYRFEGDVSEEGKYYIKNDDLYLLTDQGDPHRKVGISKLTPDSLSIEMVDSTGTKIVRFFRQSF